MKIPVLEGDRGNRGEKNTEGDQTNLGLEEEKVLELKEQWLDGEEYILKAIAEGNRAVGIAGSEKIEEHQTYYSAEPLKMQQRLMRQVHKRCWI